MSRGEPRERAACGERWESETESGREEIVREEIVISRDRAHRELDVDGDSETHTHLTRLTRVRCVTVSAPESEHDRDRIILCAHFV